MADKLELENQIFARAGVLGVAVHARNGGLYVMCKDPKLHALVAVYNAFFQKGNYQAFCADTEALAGWKAYLAQYPFAVGLTPFYASNEWKFEVIVSEEK